MYGSYWDEDWSSGGTGTLTPWSNQQTTQTAINAPTWLPSQSLGNPVNNYQWTPPPGPSASERKAAESRARASAMAADALHGVQPRNNHHRSLRGFSDAPRRPVYRGSRGGR